MTALKKINPDIKVLLCSGYSEGRAGSGNFNARMHEFHPKAIQRQWSFPENQRNHRSADEYAFFEFGADNFTRLCPYLEGITVPQQTLTALKAS